jgi:WD40 repeat protein
MMHTTTAKQLDSENPWPGLESFEENAHTFFYGRDHEAESLLNRVRDAPVTVLYGRSGLGKTSLLRAGLFPLLRDHDLLPVYVRLEPKPGAAPLTRQLHQSIHDSIRSGVADAMLPLDDESVWEYLHRTDFELWSAHNYPLTPVIVLDQFEELFTLGERVPGQVREFMNDLGDLAENRIPADLAARINDDVTAAERFNLRSRNYKLLITLREDFLPELEGWCRLIPTLGRSRLRLLRLRADEALDAVHKPAAHLITDSLARRVVAIIAGEDLHSGDSTGADGDRSDDHFGASDVEPALLSLFCRELNEERKRRGQQQFDERLVEDAKRDILSNYYSSCVGDLPPRVAGFIESELITEKGFRDSFIREDAVPTRLTEEELAQLISSRLLRLEDRYGAQRIELTHDVLTRVVRQHRDRRRAEEEKAALAARAEQERQALEEAATQREAELDRERRARLESERAGQRLRRLSAVLAIVCIVAVVLAVVAIRYANSAKRARDDALAERLASQGLAILSGGQPGSESEALDELLEAQHLSNSPDVVGTVLTALSRKARLQKVFDLPPEGTFNTDSMTFTVRGHLTAQGEHVITRTTAGFQILDTQTGEPIGAPFADPHDMVEGVSPNGRYLAIVGKDHSIHVWDSDSRQPFGLPLPGNDSIFRAGVAVSSDGRHVAAADSKNTVRLWEAQTGRQIATLVGRADARVTALVFSPDGRSLASAGNEHTVRLWDSETGAALRETTRAGDERLKTNDTIVSLAFSPDGRTIAAGGVTVGLAHVLSAGSPLRLWNLDTGEAIGTPLTDNYGVIRSIAFSPEGDRVVTAGSDKTVRFWDARTGQPIGDPLGLQSPVYNVAFTRQGNGIVSVSGDTVQKFDVDQAVGLPVETHGSKVAHLAGTNAAFGLYAMTDAPRIAVVGDGSLRWLDPDTGEQVGPAVVSDALREIKHLEMSTDRRWLAIPGPDNTVRILDASNGQPYGGVLRGHGDAINAMAFSPDGQVIATVSDDKTVRLWDWRNGHQIGEPMTGHNDGVQTVEFSEDGRRLMSRSVDSIRVWDTASRKAIGKPIGGSDSPYIFSSAKLSPDGRRIAAATPLTIQEWDADTGNPVGSPMLGNSDKTIDDIAYSPDGRYLVSISQDRTLRFWDTTSGRQIGEPFDITVVGGTIYVGFSHDARHVFITAQRLSLSGSPPYVGGGIWQIPAPKVWVDALCDKLVSNPSEQQWQDWISPDVPYQEPCRGKRRSH